MGKIPLLPPHMIEHTRDQTTTLSPMWKHQSLGAPATTRPLPLATAVAPVLDAASMARPVRCRIPGLSTSAVAQATSLERKRVLRALTRVRQAMLRGAPGCPRHRCSGRDVPQRLVEKSASRSTPGRDEAWSRHPQDPGLRDSLSRGPGVGAGRVRWSGSHALAADPSTGTSRLHRWLRHVVERHWDRSQRRRAPAVAQG